MTIPWELEGRQEEIVRVALGLEHQRMTSSKLLLRSIPWLPSSEVPHGHNIHPAAPAACQGSFTQTSV